MFDNFVRRELVDVLVVLSRDRESLLQLADLRFLLSDDEFEACFDVLVALHLKYDELFVLVELVTERLVDFNKLLTHLLDLLLRLLLQSHSLLLHQCLLNLKLFYLTFALLALLLESVKHLSKRLHLELDRLQLVQ